MAMQVVERENGWKRINREVLDVTGERYGFLTAVRFVGFVFGHYSAWEFICDCGKTVVRSVAHVRHAAKNPAGLQRSRLHCGCQSPRTGKSKKPGYAKWKELKNSGRLGSEWAASFEAFESQCLTVRNGDRFLCRRDTSRLLGPDNFFWSRFDESHFEFEAKAVRVLMDRGMTEAEAVAKSASVSRQRRLQWIWKAEGKCTQCGNTRESLASLCLRCNERQLMAKRVNEIPSRAQYPWDEWLDGSTWELEPGIDFTASVPAVRQSAWSAASTRGLDLITRFRGGKLYLKALPQIVKAEATA